MKIIILVKNKFRFQFNVESLKVMNVMIVCNDDSTTKGPTEEILRPCAMFIEAQMNTLPGGLGRSIASQTLILSSRALKPASSSSK